MPIKTLKKSQPAGRQGPPIDPNRLPPQDIEAEQSVLGSLLIDRDAMFKIADIVKPEDFYRKAHEMIFRVMVEGIV